MEKLSKAEQILYNICLKQTEELFMKEVENVHKELKYYTPEIEDIRVGYEYEYKTHNGVNYSKEEFDKLPWEKGIYGFNDFPYVERTMKGRMQFQTVRVPYLTKEQIEAEGWKQMPPPIISISKEFRNIPFIKNGYRLDYNLNSNQLSITVNEQFLFYGECKSINELRTICKLLNIK